MANIKISALTSATTPLAGTEVLPIVQSGVTVKVTNNDLRPKQIQSNATSGVLQVAGPAAASTRVMTTPDANFTTARTDAAQSFTGDQTLSTGNLVQGTAAKGFNFTANTPAAGMTSRLLNWYEEGTWTPADASGAGLSITVNAAYYTRIGRSITFYLDVTYPTTASANNACLTIPFASSADGGGSIGYNNIGYATQLFVNITNSIQVVRLLTNAGLTLTNVALSTKRFQITGQYIA